LADFAKADDGRENQNPESIRPTRGGWHDSNADEISASRQGRFLFSNPKALRHSVGFRCAIAHQPHP